MGRAELSREQFARDARTVLVALRENERSGRSNKLADVKGELEEQLSSAFETYYAFLRRHALLLLDRQATLKLTPEGERLVDSGNWEKLERLDDAASHVRLGVEGGGEGARYAPYELLGEGPIALVHRGRHAGLSLDVAIKELKDLFGAFTFLDRAEVARRLQQELKAQAAIRHPSIVPILDHDCDATRLSFVMELCPGGSLRSRLDAAQGKPLELRLALRLFLQAAYALRAAHAQGLVHGNLKPENLLFDAFGNMRLADFGLSRIVDPPREKKLPQVFFGSRTFAYLSPEQASGELEPRALTPATDIYAMGVLLYEMLTGTLPARRSPALNVANPQIPAALDAVFERMCADKREARSPDFDAVLDGFYGAFDDGSFLAKGDLLLESAAPARAQSAHAEGITSLSA